jgi:hypothetical protein
MAQRRPLVLIDGEPSRLPVGDTLLGVPVPTEAYFLIDDTRPTWFEVPGTVLSVHLNGLKERHYITEEGGVLLNFDPEAGDELLITYDASA